jgi:hypothetical protein
MRIEEEAHNLLPAIQFFRRKRLKEFRTNDELPFQNAEFAAAFAAVDRHQTNYGIGPSRNDDVFPAACLLNEAGKVRLGFVNSDRLQVS